MLGVAVAVFVAAAAACSGTNPGAVGVDPDAGPGGTQGEGGPSPDDPGNQAPHALGTIVLGMARASGASNASPIVLATFVPDAKIAAAAACKEVLESCEVTVAPKCSETKDLAGCAAGKVCGWSASCQAVCTIIPLCDKACAKDERCVAKDAKTPAGTCTKIEPFDAGPLAFSGTTTPITLYPPYAYESEGTGAPFLAGSELRVQAQGATAAGFEPFDETFTATTFLQTTPALEDLPRGEVFGSAALQVKWAPGKDVVLVTVSGSGGSATCRGSDATGKLGVPRAVINRVLGESGGGLTLSVARQRTETKKNQKAKGPLASAEVQPVGWLDLVTSSSETASFAGCTEGLTACGESDCVDTKTDPSNCGACGTKCSAQCSAGKCGTPPPGCTPGPENTLARCSDGCSNDGDPYIDCNDFDCCPVRNDCPATTSCGKK